jgi:hypothetical protein
MSCVAYFRIGSRGDVVFSRILLKILQHGRTKGSTYRTFSEYSQKVLARWKHIGGNGIITSPKIDILENSDAIYLISIFNFFNLNL